LALPQCSGGDVSLNATSRGDDGLLDHRIMGFFCSVRCPGDSVLKIYDLARALRSANVTIAGGFQSPMEKECLSLLLRGTVGVIVCPARGLGTMREPTEWKAPLAEGRLLLLSFFDDGVRRATTDLAARRNAYVALLADRILIAHAERGGKTERLCRDALDCGKPVFTLDSPDNAHLVELGAVPVRADDPAPLIEK
jgi:predicted Rossmann fold nucleotide-binding protein DprA/Smf involved in DNA uptake